MSSALERSIQFGILAVLLLAPTQWGFEVRPKTFISPVDPLLALTAGLAFLGVLQRRLAQRISAPSPFAVLFVVFGAISITAAPSRVDAVKELAQWGLYFVAAWILFRYILEDARTRGTAILLATVATLAVLAAATVQFFRSGVADMDVRGFFGNRNVLAGFLALALPFAFAQTLVNVNPVAALAGLLVTLLGLCVTLSGAAVLAVFVALLAMAAWHGRSAPAATIIFVLLVTALVHPNLPRRAGLDVPWPDAAEWRDPWIGSIALHDDAGEVSRRYPAWETAWLIAMDHPWRGIGAGNYEGVMREGKYRRIPTRPGPPEPDTENLYLVLAASIGLPGLLMFVAMLLEGMSMSLRTAHSTRRTEPADRALALGAFGSLLAYAIAAIWHPLLVRGIGIPLVAVLALTHHLHARAGRD